MAENDSTTIEQTVLVLQGGGALGAYQLGVYQALHEAGLEPDWVIGTSIGAINGALIAGNPPERRLERLEAFWRKITRSAPTPAIGGFAALGRPLAELGVFTQGVPGFFAPNPLALWGPALEVGTRNAAFYSAEPLRRTLGELVDFEHLNGQGTRLTVGAVRVDTGTMRYFDSREEPIALEHVLASGALPPAFPAVQVNGHFYWDGGIYSNTPIEAVFDDRPRRSGLVFAVNLWHHGDDPPRSILQAMSRHKDIQYASRLYGHVERQQQIHRLRHVILELTRQLPEGCRDDPAVRALSAYGCATRMHVVRLAAPRLAGETHLKDIDFSAEGIGSRRTAGYADTRRVLEQAPWTGTFDALEGVILHEAGAP